MNRISKLVTFWAVLLIFLVGCTNNQESYAPWGMTYDGQKEIHVGISADYPPLAFKENGHLQGAEVSMAEALAYEFQAKIVFHELSWKDLIPELLAKKIDIIMSGITITASRQQQVSFAQPYMQVGQMALIRKQEKPQFPDPQSLLQTNLRIGYLPNTTSQLFVKKHFKKSKLHAMSSVQQAVNGLRTNTIDVFIHDAPTIWLIAGNPTEMELTGLYWPLTKENLAWAVRPADYNLLAALNKTISSWQQNGKLQEILNQWMKIRIEIQP